MSSLSSGKVKSSNDYGVPYTSLNEQSNGAPIFKREMFESKSSKVKPRPGGFEHATRNNVQTKRPCMLYPNTPFKNGWDLMLFALIVYSSLIVPYRLCFDVESEGYLKVFDAMLDLFFVTDLTMNFFTAFVNSDGRLITDREVIAKSYLKGWFIIDMPASIPVDFIAFAMELAGNTGETSDAMKWPRLMRTLRLIRLVRLLRLLKLQEYMVLIEEKFDVSMKFMNLLKMFILIAFVSHFLACFFYMVQYGQEQSWLLAYDPNVAEDDIGTRYLYSIYWAMTTMTTVGYGDTLPTTNPEIGYTLMTFVMGAVVFGYMLGQVASLINSMNHVGLMFEERMESTKEYMAYRRFPKPLAIRVRKYYEYYWAKRSVFDEHHILANLTPGLRLEVQQHLAKDLMDNVTLFKNQTPEFVTTLMTLMRPVDVAREDIVLRKGEKSMEMFAILRGRVMITTEHCNSAIDEGRVFGEESLLTESVSSRTYQAATHCELLSLSRIDLKGVSRKFPVAVQQLHLDLLTNQVETNYRMLMRMKMVVAFMPRDNRKNELIRASLFLQTAWRSHKLRDLNEQLRQCEEKYTQLSKTKKDSRSASEGSGWNGNGASGAGTGDFQGQLDFVQLSMNSRFDALEYKLDALLKQMNSQNMRILPQLFNPASESNTQRSRISNTSSRVSSPKSLLETQLTHPAFPRTGSYNC